MNRRVSRDLWPGNFFKLNFFAALTRRRNVYTIVNSRGNGGYRAGYLFPLVSVFQPVKYENAFRTLAKQRPRKRTDVVKGFSSAVRSNSFLNSDRDQANYTANFTTVIWSRCVSLSLSLSLWKSFDKISILEERGGDPFRKKGGGFVGRRKPRTIYQKIGSPQGDVLLVLRNVRLSLWNVSVRSSTTEHRRSRRRKRGMSYVGIVATLLKS